ncbi:MAG: hypothetical protein CMJ52_10445 [Planctomycetaceae bacterium]|nr:hypothetical protein [Planctomycetaceae bacterium]
MEKLKEKLLNLMWKVSMKDAFISSESRLSTTKEKVSLLKLMLLFVQRIPMILQALLKSQNLMTGTENGSKSPGNLHWMMVDQKLPTMLLRDKKSSAPNGSNTWTQTQMSVKPSAQI